MSKRLCAAIGVLWLSAAPAVAQDHGAAKHEPAKAAPEPVKVVPVKAVPEPAATTPKQLNVTPTVPPAKVAAAVAEAIRAAEAAEARRAARVAAVRPEPVRRTPIATPRARRYDVSWPSQRMVVQWPVSTSDRVTLTWPE